MDTRFGTLSPEGAALLDLSKFIDRAQRYRVMSGTYVSALVFLNVVATTLMNNILIKLLNMCQKKIIPPGSTECKVYVSIA